MPVTSEKYKTDYYFKKVNDNTGKTVAITEHKEGKTERTNEQSIHTYNKKSKQKNR